MRLLDLLPARRVRAGLVAADKEAVLDAVATLLAPGSDYRQVRDALAARERLGTTGLGQGVAIPHGRSAAIDEARAAFVRLARPVDFGAENGEGVDLVAALVVPAHFTDEHLELLAELAELFTDRTLVNRLRTAADTAALYQALAAGLEALPRG